MWRFAFDFAVGVCVNTSMRGASTAQRPTAWIPPSPARSSASPTKVLRLRPGSPRRRRVASAWNPAGPRSVGGVSTRRPAWRWKSRSGWRLLGGASGASSGPIAMMLSFGSAGALSPLRTAAGMSGRALPTAQTAALMCSASSRTSRIAALPERPVFDWATTLRMASARAGELWRETSSGSTPTASLRGLLPVRVPAAAPPRPGWRSLARSTAKRMSGSGRTSRKPPSSRVRLGAMTRSRSTPLRRVAGLFVRRILVIARR